VTDDLPEFIGNASMTPDGTVHLDMFAPIPGGGRGFGRMSYAPDHPQYQYVLDHLGGLKPGEQKAVRPFPDEEEEASAQAPGPATGIDCPSCKTRNRPKSRFCKHCGRSLLS
jgi:hypothetical protein